MDYISSNNEVTTKNFNRQHSVTSPIHHQTSHHFGTSTNYQYLHRFCQWLMWYTGPAQLWCRHQQQYHSFYGDSMNTPSIFYHWRSSPGLLIATRWNPLGGYLYLILIRCHMVLRGICCTCGMVWWMWSMFGCPDPVGTDGMHPLRVSKMVKFFALLAAISVTAL